MWEVGDIYEDEASGNVYKILSTTDFSVSFLGTVNKKQKNIVVPNTIMIENVKYKVTQIGAKAFYNQKKLQKVTIGKQIRKIGAKAFWGCKKLRNIKLNTVLLKKEMIGNKAFLCGGKVRVKVPKEVKDTYEKVLKEKGLKKLVIIS